MKALLRMTLAVALIPTTLLAPQVSSAQEKMREGLTYVGLMATRLNHRSVDDVFNGETWSSAAALLLGTNISENFHAEIRLGGGTNSGDIDNELRVKIDYYASWYIGGHYPVTSYANVYGQFGFTHVKGESELTPFGRYRAFTDPSDLPEDLRGRTWEEAAEKDYPESSFSVSWLAGAEFELIDGGFLFLEGGKLFEDTETNANVFQYNAGLKYEF